MERRRAQSQAAKCQMPSHRIISLASFIDLEVVVASSSNVCNASVFDVRDTDYTQNLTGY
jgi:hypothetical protein